jgi:predicted component of type VI protein secretion system
MATAVRLMVLTGPHKDRTFCFCGPNRCQVGRALDCFVRLSGAERDQLISRHHCQLDIDPPAVRVRDLGSSNGTFLNGKEVKTGPKAQPEIVGVVVNDGDLLTVGGTTLRVEVVDCPHAENGGETAPKPKGYPPAWCRGSLPPHLPWPHRRGP